MGVNVIPLEFSALAEYKELWTVDIGPKKCLRNSGPEEQLRRGNKTQRKSSLRTSGRTTERDRGSKRDILKQRQGEWLRGTKTELEKLSENIKQNHREKPRLTWRSSQHSNGEPLWETPQSERHLDSKRASRSHWIAEHRLDCRIKVLLWLFNLLGLPPGCTEAVECDLHPEAEHVQRDPRPALGREWEHASSESTLTQQASNAPTHPHTHTLPLSNSIHYTTTGYKSVGKVERDAQIARQRERQDLWKSFML